MNFYRFIEDHIHIDTAHTSAHSLSKHFFSTYSPLDSVSEYGKHKNQFSLCPRHINSFPVPLVVTGSSQWEECAFLRFWSFKSL